MKMTLISVLALFSLSACGQGAQRQASAAAVTGPSQDAVATLAAPADVVLEWDKTVHDFGDVSVGDGPLRCSFTLTNKGKDPLVIYEVVSSCGCTDVTWTRESIPAGGSGTISATYKNEDGPLPFDKTLTVYISGVQRPVILRLRGVVHPKKQSLSQLYGGAKLGDLGLKTREYKTGTVRQGLSAAESAQVANLGKKPLQLAFADVSEGLQISVSPNPIPAESTATLQFSVSAIPGRYGKGIYRATPVLNGRKADEPITVTAWTQENFTNLTSQERAAAAVPLFTDSTINFDTVEAGKVLDLSFECKNDGQSPLHFYALDSESPALTLVGQLPVLAPKEKGSIHLKLDTSLLEKDEIVIMVSLTTNSPLRPLVNLFVAGAIRP